MNLSRTLFRTATSTKRPSLITRPTFTSSQALIAKRCKSTWIESGPSYWTVNGQVCPYGEANFIHDPTGEIYSTIKFDKKGPQPRICMVWDKRELNVMPGSISFYAHDSTHEFDSKATEKSGEVDWV